MVWGNQNNVIPGKVKPGKVIPGKVIPGKIVYMCLVIHGNIMSDSWEYQVIVFGCTWEFVFFIFLFIKN